MGEEISASYKYQSNGVPITLQSIYMVTLIVGFALVSLIPALTGNSDFSFTILYRGLILVSSIMLTIHILTTSFSSTAYKSTFFLAGFWLLYLFRLIYDLYVIQISLVHDKTSFDYIQLVFGVVLPPVITIGLMNFNKLNWEFILSWVYRLLFITLAIAILHRFSVGASGRSHGGLQVGILLYGQFGTTLCLLSIFLLLRKWNVLYFIGFSVGLATIIISASKSPIVALLIAITAFLASKYGKTKGVLMLFVFGLIGYYLLGDTFVYLNNYLDSSFLERIESSLEDGDSARTLRVTMAIQGFLTSPFFGKSMLIQEGLCVGCYPHNLIAESFMATGFIGGVLFCGWIICGLTSWRRLVNYDFNSSWIGLLFIQFLLFGMFSGNLCNSTLFWYFSVLVVKKGREVNLSSVKNG
jgi:hypothetical protein